MDLNPTTSADSPRALSVLQPWASALALGLKAYETRSWATTYRGPVLIHASAAWKRDARAAFYGDPCIRAGFRGLGMDDHRALPLGRFVGTATLVACHRVEDVRHLLSVPELHFGDYSAGRYAWELADVRPWDGPHARGALGLWRPHGVRLPCPADTDGDGDCLRYWCDHCRPEHGPRPEGAANPGDADMTPPTPRLFQP